MLETPQKATDYKLQVPINYFTLLLHYILQQKS